MLPRVGPERNPIPSSTEWESYLGYHFHVLAGYIILNPVPAVLLTEADKWN
jgi:hypothetical protein